MDCPEGREILSGVKAPAGVAGPALVLAFALNGVVTLLTAMVYAELGSAIPEAGGGYLWIKEGLPGANAFLAGWMSWFAHAVAGGLYALGFGAFLFELLRILGVSLEAAGLDFGLAQKLFGLGIVVVVPIYMLVAFAMGRDRSLPDSLRRVHEGRRTPYVSLLWTAVLESFTYRGDDLHRVPEIGSPSLCVDGI